MKLLRLILFIVAAIALFLTGSLFAPSMPSFNFVLLMYTTAVGTWFLYGMNYRVFNRNKIKESFHSLGQVTVQNFMIFHFILIVLPLLLKFISWFQIQLFIVLIILAWLYAFAFVINGKRYKLKERLLIKNLLIGFTWGALTILPFTHWGSIYWPLFYMVGFQIFIGSTLRDFDDIDHDRQFNIKTLPSILGIQKTASILQLINVIGLLMITAICNDTPFKIITGIACIWRAVNIYLASKADKQTAWTQTWNIATCLVIYVTSLIIYSS